MLHDGDFVRYTLNVRPLLESAKKSGCTEQ